MLQVGHLERYNPAVLAASEMVKEPVFIESERLSPFLGRGTDVDVTLDLMIHDVDIMLSLISSPVKEIRAVGAKVLTNKIDVAKAWLAFQNGCIALYARADDFRKVAARLAERWKADGAGVKKLAQDAAPAGKQELQRQTLDASQLARWENGFLQQVRNEQDELPRRLRRGQQVSHGAAAGAAARAGRGEAG